MQERKELLASAVSYMGQFEAGIGSLIVQIRVGKISEALQTLVDGIEGIMFIVHAVDSCGDLMSDPIDVSVMNEHLGAMNEALEHQDYVLLADLLEYEVVPIVSDWKQQILQILD